MTLADAVSGTWTAADNTGGFGEQQLPTTQHTQNHWTGVPLMTADRLSYPIQPAMNVPLSTAYSYPTVYNGRFAQAMSSIARNPDTGIPGRVTTGHLDDNFKTEVSQALAIKLNLKTRQHAHKKVLQNMVGSGGKCSSLKQAVQARAAVYGEVVDPALFARNQDTSRKARTSTLRRTIRSQLAASPLIVAQVGLQRVTALLNTGDSQALARVRLGEQRSVAETLKILSRAPPMSVLKLLDRTRAHELGSLAARVSAELDFTQTVLDLVATRDSLNPSVNAVAEAFRRRSIGGKFASGDHSIQVDSLVYAASSTPTDFDHCATDFRSTGNRRPTSPSQQRTTCIDFQRGDCRWRSCRFDHRCSSCGKWGHGLRDCWQLNESRPTPRRRTSQRTSTSRRDNSSSTPADVPPHPRRRTDRTD